MVAKRKSEKFKRIKGSTLAKLLQENNNDESVYQLAEMGGDQVRRTIRNQLKLDVTGVNFSPRKQNGRRSIR
jgi:hypothetical protein